MITSRSVDGGIQGTEGCPKSPAGKEQYWVLSSDRLAQSFYSSHHACSSVWVHVHICLHIYELCLGS